MRKVAMVVIAGLVVGTAVVGQQAAGEACAPATVSIGDVLPTYEGTFVGQTQFVFPVTVSVAPGCPKPTGQVSFASVPGEAGPGDFGAVSGVLDWEGSAQTQSVVVGVVADAVAEYAESFSVVLSAPEGVAIGDGTGEATILDDERPPLTVSLDGGKICWREPVNTTTCPIPVRLSTVAKAPVSVRYRTHRIGSDPLGYVPVRDGVLTIQPGQSGGNILLTVLGDRRQSDERLVVEIFAPTAGTLGVARAEVVIRPAR
ncbi:Calx-beta domain-containing protein [Actinokineospora sp. 24-640]